MRSDIWPVKNAVLAYDVLDTIKKHPDALEMNVFAGRVTSTGLDRHMDVPVVLEELTADSCGTVACFAGWTVALQGYALGDRYAFKGSSYELHEPISDLAERFLGLTGDEAHYLFFGTGNGELESRISEIFGPDPRPQR